MSKRVPDEVKKKGNQIRGRKWYDKNKELTLERVREWKYKNPYKYFFNQYKSSAKFRKLTFNLTLEQFSKIIKEPCFYCGSIPELKNGIDRKLNDVGYELYNCVSCCKRCNFMKHTENSIEFIQKCHDIVEYQKRMKL